MKGANVRTAVRITFEEAVFGCEKEIEINYKEVCSSCNGTGAKPGTSPQTCTKCNGKGKIMYTQQSFFGQVQNVQTCPECNGTGKVIRKNALTVMVPDTRLSVRNLKFLFLQVLTMASASVWLAAVSREQMAAREVTC